MIAASSAVSLKRLSEPSVYMSKVYRWVIEKDALIISKSRSIRSFLAVLSANTDLTSWMSSVLTDMVGRS